MSYSNNFRKKLLGKISLDDKGLYIQSQSKETLTERWRSIENRRNLKFMRYNTTYSRLLKLVLDMSEREQLRLLEYAKSIIDERTLPRYPCLIPVNCTVEEQTYGGLILDINSRGAYIDTDESFYIGQKIVGQKIGLQFYNPFSLQDMQLGGKIIRSNSAGIGVSFKDWARMRYKQ